MKTFTVHSKKYGDKIVKVDDEDYERVMNYPGKWYYRHHEKRTGYIATTVRGSGAKLFLHHFIVGRRDGLLVDHRDTDGLNNQKSNLRFANNSQNQTNRSGKKNKYRGVYFFKNCQKWGAIVEKDGKQYYGGYFEDEIEAAKASDALRKKLHGEFAVLNFPDKK